MSDDKKLLDVLSTVTKELSNLKCAWFTTYAIDPFLVESYVVPTLLGEDKPKDIYDYESLTEKYASMHEGGQLDVRFFYDPGALITSNQKRTSIPMHAIPLRRMGTQFSEGVFHPKVWYLQSRVVDGSQPRGVVVVSSANLTISGWGENREAVLVREISSAANLDALAQFFGLIFETAGESRAIVDETLEPLREHLLASNEQEDWRFVYTDPSSPTQFLELLLSEGTGTAPTLQVWSPYWSADLDGLVATIRREHSANAKFSFYPDMVDENRPRLSESQRQRIGSLSNCFFCDPAYSTPERFTHAKMWRAGSNFAIGSWNFTHAALGRTEEHNNVEAGILVFDAPEAMLPKEGPGTKRTDAKNTVPVPDDEAEEELDAPGEAPNVRVSFDWKTREYTVQIDHTDSDEHSRWLVTLPGIKQKITLSDAREKSIYLPPDRVGALVLSRMFTIRRPAASNDETVYGYVNEVNIATHRQSMRYSDLDELLRHLQVSGRDEGLAGSGKGVLNVPRDRAELADEEAYSRQVKQNMGDIVSSYFTMFRAFYEKVRQIEDLATDDTDRIRLAIESGPGNLTELWNHVETAVTSPSGTYSTVYAYLLLREYVTLITRARAKVASMHLELGDTWKSHLASLQEEAANRMSCLRTTLVNQLEGSAERRATLSLIDYAYGEEV